MELEVLCLGDGGFVILISITISAEIEQVDVETLFASRYREVGEHLDLISLQRAPAFQDSELQDIIRGLLFREGQEEERIKRAKAVGLNDSGVVLSALLVALS